ncbi:MAG: RelA/SpoT family protein [Candidatus Elulimicrobiales bacterium]|nr:RelA/SpoT family protein [Candidatus Elulimicrobiales bacterium]
MEENKEISNPQKEKYLLEDIFEAVPKEKALEKEDKILIEKAFEFAKKAHEGHLRKSGEPYFVHCVETAKNIARQNMDVNTIAAGLLHDTLEDVDVSEEILKEEFGDEILTLVQGVSKLGTIKYKGVERHAESMRKFFVALADDIRVVVIKLCDRLHNVSTLQYIEEEKRKRLAIETLEIHARLADRIGMGKLKGELEDEAFPYAYPDDFEKVKEMFDSVSTASEDYLLKILTRVKDELSIFDIKYLKIDHRLKHLYSLYEKLKKHSWDIQKIYDIAAMRIIVEDVGTCYQALGVIHGLYRPVPGRFKDYIALPKPNGYQSLHTTVFDGEGGTFEVQIRTLQMHEEAEYGIASHLAYKEVGDSKKIKNKQEKSKMSSINEKIAWTKELFQPQDIDSENKDFIKNIKEEFFDKTLFIHTPKGDVIEMPEGSGVIDFAYMVHSDIGNHISGVMVNGKMVSLDTKLKDGNMVEIITKEDAKPGHKWLNYASTSLAKRHIRNYLKEHNL